MKLNKINKTIKNKKVLLRLDLNVAMKDGKVLEDFKIDRTLPTIKQLLKQNCQLVIISHLGRPNGRWNNKLSLEKIALILNKKLKTAVNFEKIKITESLVEIIYKSKKNIILLENIRFYKGEATNDPKFAELLSGLADIYVNDAFACCHRDTASITGITNYLSSFAGLNLINEVKFLGHALKPKKPAIGFIGGVKIKSKMGVIKHFLKKYNKIFIGGGVANTYFASKGYVVGSSVVDVEYINYAKKLPVKKIIYPVDFIIANIKDKSIKRYHKLEWGKEICNKDEMILDIGPETIKLFIKELNKTKTVVWSGPFGLIDEKPFEKGSVALAKLIAGSKAMSIVGGGETTASVNMARVSKKINFISTGGGAMLNFLEGDLLPGLKVLQK